MRSGASIMAVGVLAVIAACGGGGDDLSAYSESERRAIERAQTILKTVYGAEVKKVVAVETDEFATEEVIWRVEVETSAGYRCVYLRNTPVGVTESAPDPDALYLLSIKGGPICAEGIYVPEG